MSASANEIKKTGSSSGTVIFLVLAVALLGIGSWIWISYKAKEAGAGEGSHQVKSSLHLEPFVLNLADKDQRSYLRVGIDLGLGREINRGENAPPVGQIRDAILGVLAQSKVDELLTEAGKSKLKADVLRALQERVPDLQVEEVYFTEFLIQR